MPIEKERSQEAILEIQGAVILVRILDDTTIFEKVINNLLDNTNT